MCKARMVERTKEEMGPAWSDHFGPNSRYFTREAMETVKLDGIEEEIDSCIAELVAGINFRGLKTKYSCCGHGEELGWIELADERYLVIFPSKIEALKVMHGIDISNGGRNNGSAPKSQEGSHADAR